MLHFPAATCFTHSRVALVFRTVIAGRAGGVPWCRLVAAEVVETDIAGTAILLTTTRTHLQFPIWALYEPTDGIAEKLTSYAGASRALETFNAERFSYVGGQELIWNIHNATQPATLRYLTVDEIAEVLTNHDAVIDAG